VLWLSQRIDTAAPAFAPAAPSRTVPGLAGFCTNSWSQDLFIFDKHQRVVTAAVPTGRSPWGVVLDPVQSRAWVSLADDDQVAMFDIANGHELSRVRLAPGDSPREILMTVDRRFIVTANAGSNTVSFIDPLGMVETARVQVGEEPVSLLQDRATARFYVFSARSSSISVIDPVTRRVVATAQTENSPLRGQIDRAGTRLYVASPRASYLTIYALPGLSVLQRVYVGVGTTALKVDPDTDLLYVANADGRVSIFDPFSLLPIDYFDAGGAVTWMSIDAAENVLFMLMPEQRSVAAMQMTTRAAAGGFDVGVEARVLALMGERN
jgi:YVTN family beta-propeller protein